MDTARAPRPWWRSLLELSALILVFSWVLYDEVRPLASVIEAAAWVLAFAGMDASVRRIRDPRTRYPIVAGAVFGALVFAVWSGLSFVAKGDGGVPSWIPFVLVGQFAVLAGAYYGYKVTLERREGR
jgi:hypothetical protein